MPIRLRQVGTLGYDPLKIATRVAMLTYGDL
jgi:hypothetical protein